MQDIIKIPRDLEKWSEISTIKDKEKCYISPIESANPYCGDRDRRASHDLNSIFDPFRAEGWALRYSLTFLGCFIFLGMIPQFQMDAWQIPEYSIAHRTKGSPVKSVAYFNSFSNSLSVISDGAYVFLV